MRQIARIISTYSADVFGVCSALFELGGMTVMHDASGCNSTYTTHDEPRWYDMDSMVYISGLSEMEAIMGDDEKLIRDIAEAAEELHPTFIAIAGTPIPAMTGFDYESVAYLIEQRTGIPTFGFPTTGMNTYVYGASMALEGYARRFVDRTVKKTEQPSANILGLTPLDFSVNGCDSSIAEFLENSGFEVISKWAMGSTPEELKMAGKAHVNLVVSATGLGVAKALWEIFGT
ncbi:MAG: oxidoreductase, partial [Lachnospiraceae bacterium]|nr:oxidoreductase [Lachnospiraceae bacterium]